MLLVWTHTERGFQMVDDIMMFCSYNEYMAKVCSPLKVNEIFVSK